MPKMTVCKLWSHSWSYNLSICVPSQLEMDVLGLLDISRALLECSGFYARYI